MATQSEVFSYRSWFGHPWLVRRRGAKFFHQPDGDTEGKPHTSDVIAYQTWNRTKWTARWEGDGFRHAPEGDFKKAHSDDILNCLDKKGRRLTVHWVNGQFCIHDQTSKRVQRARKRKKA